MRLAFAVAVHVNPEILIVDEILAVGDTDFQAKCFKKMEDFKKQGVTIIFVSHNMDQIKNFCTKVIYLKDHQIKTIGEPIEIIKIYREDLSK